jgi:hypothetical protein
VKVDVGGEKVFGGGLDTVVEEGGLGLGVGEGGEDLVGEGSESVKLFLEELACEGRAADGLAQDAEARGAFGGRME